MEEVKADIDAIIAKAHEVNQNIKAMDRDIENEAEHIDDSFHDKLDELLEYRKNLIMVLKNELGKM